MKMNRPTKEQCLRNNWNSINHSIPEEKTFRISFQNHTSGLTQEDIDFYIKYLWNERTEKEGRRLFGKKWT